MAAFWPTRSPTGEVVKVGLGRIEPLADNSIPLSVIAGADELIEQGSL
jgi:hypothetical protein